MSTPEPPPDSGRSWWQRMRAGLLLRVALTVTLVGLIIWRLGGFGDLWQRLVSLRPWLAAVVLLVITVDRILMTLKWSMLLRSQGIELPFWAAMRVYCASLVWGMFLPATLGADAVRAYSTRRLGVDTDDVVASIVVERMLGFLAALILGLFGYMVILQAGVVDARFEKIAWIGGGALPLVTLLFAASFHSRLYELVFHGLFGRFRRGRLIRRLDEFQAKYSLYRRQLRTLTSFAGLTMIEQLFPILYAWLIAVGLGVDVSLLYMAGALPLALLISRIPIAIQGIGVFDGVFLLLMVAAGVPPADAVAITVMVRLLEGLAWFPWWLAHVVELGNVRPPRVTASVG